MHKTTLAHNLKIWNFCKANLPLLSQTNEDVLTTRQARHFTFYKAFLVACVSCTCIHNAMLLTS